ncbi:DUF6461 domain-containing protein [Rhodococcoides fascians]|uniref:DUF6461 domain-containing protein n=1 Tax=Rhodococcoides fascians TaxID=1828 RepID=UPI000560A753|nr:MULTISPECIES: DUF6461 domain-containing protein [Rhodococcus]OZE95981.1 hypothetical protein CH301_21185 [Rhodococcus sp. 15-1189-1-1a]OZF10864.1 hypothetical protein CH299_21700 [Rhodococcus sp. 14-2686-1-2]
MHFRDFDWLQSYSDWIDNGYCVTLVRQVPPSMMLDHLGTVSERTSVTGFADILLEAWDFEEDGLVALMKTEVVGVADAGGGWSILVEQNSGYLGMTENLIRPVIGDHEAFVLYKNIEGLARFLWWREGVKLVDFETRLGAPAAAASAISSEFANTIVAALERVGGMPLTEHEPPDIGYTTDQAAFALASELGGMRVEPALFQSGSFTVAVVPTTSDDVETARDVDDPIDSAPTWSRMVRMHRNAMKKTTIHAIVTEYDEGRTPEGVSFEFWFKPRRSWMLSDKRGIFFVQNRRQDIWFRKDGVLIPRGDEGFSLPLWPGDTIDFLHAVELDLGRETKAETLIDPQTLGEETDVGGRSAWEFRLPDIVRGHPRHVAFDQETGVIVRRVRGSNIGQLSNLVVGEKYDDTLFDGDRYCKPAES